MRKEQIGGNKMIKPILLVGYTGSGKSTLALIYSIFNIFYRFIITSDNNIINI